MKNKIIQRIINEDKSLMIEIKQEDRKKNVYLVETNEDLEHERIIKIGITTLSKENLIHFVGVMDMVETLYNNNNDLLIQILKNRKLIK